MKMWKKVAIAFSAFVAFCVAFDLIGRLIYPGYWAQIDKKTQERREERAKLKAQEDKEKEEKGKPTGAMYMGGVVAVQMAHDGAVKPSADRVNALAREAATKSDAKADDRSRFIRDFEFGFWQGWKSATK